jgi:hypothetical protein
MNRFAFWIVAVVAILGIGATAQGASEPNWWPVVIARGEERQWVESLPIEDRPYRPFHFYGNAVRRQHYRGSAMPMPRDMVLGTRSLILRR